MAYISYNRASGGETKETVDYDALDISESAVWLPQDDGGMRIIPLGNVNYIDVDESELENDLPSE